MTKSVKNARRMSQAANSLLVAHPRTTAFKFNSFINFYAAVNDHVPYIHNIESK